jgi:hypothetical protein
VIGSFVASVKFTASRRDREACRIKALLDLWTPAKTLPDDLAL